MLRSNTGSTQAYLSSAQAFKGQVFIILFCKVFNFFYILENMFWKTEIFEIVQKLSKSTRVSPIHTNIYTYIHTYIYLKLSKLICVSFLGCERNLDHLKALRSSLWSMMVLHHGREIRCRF